MRNIGVVFAREFRSYFDRPIAYVFVIVYLLISTIFFMNGFFLQGNADLRGFFGNLPLFNLILLPAVSMGLWAEDRRSGTMELLMTFPMKSYEIVLGKYLAALAFYAIALAGTLTLPIMVAALGNPDTGAMFTGYLGAFMLGAFYLAIGIFVSGLFKDQITAFLVTALACFFFFLVGQGFMAAIIDGWIGGLGSFLQDSVSLSGHYDTIQRGVIDAGTVVYFGSMVVLFVLLNTLSLEGRRY